MSAFGSYIVVTALADIGWPRRKSFLRPTPIVDAVLLDVVIDQMIDWAVALGACRPRTALQALATIYRDRDWNGPDAPDILEFARSTNGWIIDRVPFHRGIRGPVSFSKHAKTIPFDQLKDPQIRKALEEMCMEGFLYGLTNPSVFTRWFTSRSADQAASQRSAGVDFGPTATLDEFLNDGDKMLTGYQTEYGPLSPIPEKLWADARELRPELTQN